MVTSSDGTITEENALDNGAFWIPGRKNINRYEIYAIVTKSLTDIIVGCPYYIPDKKSERYPFHFSLIMHQ